jgi:hypothetical protein
MQLTIFFDSPFWVGVLEEQRGDMVFAARYVFGAEPSAERVYEFVLTELDALRAQMTTGVPAEQTRRKRINPKRMQRAIRREMQEQGVTRKAHEAMRLQYEQNQQTRRESTRAEREAERKRKRRLKREKAREKHRGH